MKRIAALTLVAALAATGAYADGANTQPTVSTQAPGFLGGLAGTGLAGGIMAAIVVTTIVVAANDSTSGT